MWMHIIIIYIYIYTLYIYIYTRDDPFSSGRQPGILCTRHVGHSRIVHCILHTDQFSCHYSTVAITTLYDRVERKSTNANL